MGMLRRCVGCEMLKCAAEGDDRCRLVPVEEGVGNVALGHVGVGHGGDVESRLRASSSGWSRRVLLADRRKVVAA
jgi:hypothetical protein